MKLTKLSTSDKLEGFRGSQEVMSSSYKLTIMNNLKSDSVSFKMNQVVSEILGLVVLRVQLFDFLLIMECASVGSCLSHALMI